jgi:hypothetical protein
MRIPNWISRDSVTLGFMLRRFAPGTLRSGRADRYTERDRSPRVKNGLIDPDLLPLHQS